LFKFQGSSGKLELVSLLRAVLTFFVLLMSPSVAFTAEPAVLADSPPQAIPAPHLQAPVRRKPTPLKPPRVLAKGAEAKTAEWFKGESFDPALAEELAPSVITQAVEELARDYVAAQGLSWEPAMAKAGHWSCRFLSGDRSNSAAFLAAAEQTVLARAGAAGRALARAAACHAWRQISRQPGYAPPSSQRARLRRLPAAARAATLADLAQFHHASCQFEGVEVLETEIAAQLQAGLGF
jgi:hypothetical protein